MWSCWSHWYGIVCCQIDAFEANTTNMVKSREDAGPGHCYRLYSAAHFHNNFDDHSQPAILNVPIEGTVLQMKAMGIDKVTNFPFPTSPSRCASSTTQFFKLRVVHDKVSLAIMVFADHPLSMPSGHSSPLELLTVKRRC